MSEKPKFHSMMIKDGRWTVAVRTGYGPVSHVGNFYRKKGKPPDRVGIENGPTQLITKVTPNAPRPQLRKID